LRGEDLPLEALGAHMPTFISYAREDAEIVSRLREELEGLGRDVWIDSRLSPDFDGCFALCLVRGYAVGGCFHYTQRVTELMSVR
jgi:hypothetical protein